MIDKIKWGYDRWRVMQHPYEEWYRLKQQIQYRIIDSFWYKKNPKLNGFRRNTHFAESYDVNGLRKVFHQTMEDIKSFRLLNVVINDITTNHEWNYDFKNKKKAPTCFVHHIDDFDYNQCEVKYVYELSRLYHLPIMAARAVCSNDEKEALHCFEQLLEWDEQNPFLGSIAWKSGNVVGIRSVNLVLSIKLLSYFPKLMEKYEDKLSTLIEYHYKYLQSHLSLFSSKGNHHIGELTGLIVISANFQFNNSDKQLKAFVEELDDEIIRLIYQDGFNKEQATRYQASYFNLFVVSWISALKKGLDISDTAKARLKSMCEILYEWRISDGQFFHVGDNDSAEMIYPYADKAYNVYDSILNDGTVLFGLGKNHNYHFDLRNYLLLGERGKKVFQKVENTPNKNYLCKLYRDSGYFVIKQEKLALLFDVGPIGLLPTMAHGHSDILSFCLFVDNKPIIVDTGSYQYNIHYKKMRDYFHGVHSHNTISVNGQHQAKIGAGMFWMSNPTVKVLDYNENSESPYCVASHNGFVRDDVDVVHCRKIELKNEERKIIITDTLCGGKNDTISLYLHFYPDVEVKHEGQVLIVDDITIENSWFSTGKIVRGDEEKPMGWYSSRYDSIEPADTFVYQMEITNCVELITVIKF